MLSNAVKFTNRNGKIIIKVEEEIRGMFPYIKFSVIDTGIGIDLSKQAEI